MVGWHVGWWGGGVGGGGVVVVVVVGWWWWWWWWGGGGGGGGETLVDALRINFCERLIFCRPRDWAFDTKSGCFQRTNIQQPRDKPILKL